MSLAKLAQRPVHTVRTSHSVAEAARRMCQHSVGALVITDASEVTPLGIITDRDLVWMISEGLNPQEAVVGQFGPRQLHTVSINDSLDDVTNKMREHAVRRLPIVDQENRLLGIVSLDDVLLLLGRELADVADAISGAFEHERRISARGEDVEHGSR